MSLTAAAADLVSRYGESATLTRSTEGTTISLKAKRYGGSLVEAGGSSGRQSFRVKIGTAELLASAWTVKAPARKDTITIGGRVRMIEDARPISEGATVALYELEVVG